MCLKIHYFVYLTLINSLVSAQNSKENIVLANVPEDGRLNFTAKAAKYGFECEEHIVTTEDGYNLLLFHIKGDTKKPVFLMHGIIDSADAFIQTGNTSMAITLARAGYDVWIGNQRGCKYSRSHVTLDADKDRIKFWNFTLQEIAVYDLPAMIDYALNSTGQKQLKAIGHSQGTALFYILGSEKPEYRFKVKLFISMAPICYLHHTRALAKGVIIVWPVVSTLFQLLGQQEIFPKAFLDLKTIVCSPKDTGYEFCAKGIFFPAAGFDPEELEPEVFRTVVGRYPDTSSIRNADHLVQIAYRKRFSKFDYGIFGNLKAYGSVLPPDYALNNNTMAIALISGKNDNLSALEDVELLKAKLPNVVFDHVMEREQFNHINYVWGKNMDSYLYPMIKDLLENYPKV